MIKEYLKETIETKKSLKEENRLLKNQIDSIMKTLNDKKLNEDYALGQANKYKSKVEEEHKKFCILEIQSSKKVSELEKEIRTLKRENKKILKELENVQMQ